MSDKTTATSPIDAYIAAAPAEVQPILHQIRATVREAAPEAQETIKYEMPTFTLHGHNLVYFSAFKNHIGFYPAPIGVEEFADDLARYGSGRGTLQFPYAEPIPLDLITRVVRYWAAHNLEKAQAKKKR